MMLREFLTLLRPALRLLVLLTLLTGVLYPLTITAMAQVLFPYQANGSLLTDDGQVIGSEWIGQAFSRPDYFWSRPSAVAYDASASSGSNLAPTSARLIENVGERVTALHTLDPDNDARIPVDLVTASGSGLDPHISPAAADYQAQRVADARGLPLATVESVIAAHIEGRQFGILGEPRVNVLRLNRALDAIDGGER